MSDDGIIEIECETCGSLCLQFPDGEIEPVERCTADEYGVLRKIAEAAARFADYSNGLIKENHPQSAVVFCGIENDLRRAVREWRALPKESEGREP